LHENLYKKVDDKERREKIGLNILNSYDISKMAKSKKH